MFDSVGCTPVATCWLVFLASQCALLVVRIHAVYDYT